MFKNISWEWFEVITGFIATAYYLIIIMIYYKNEVLRLFVPKAALDLINSSEDENSKDENSEDYSISQ